MGALQLPRGGVRVQEIGTRAGGVGSSVKVDGGGIPTGPPQSQLALRRQLGQTVDLDTQPGEVLEVTQRVDGGRRAVAADDRPGFAAVVRIVLIVVDPEDERL